MNTQQVILQHILTTPPVMLAPSLHVAIITDGNGRWATHRGLPRSAGHRAGAEASRSVIEAAPKLGIHTLTLFALSSANWKRPPAEVNGILRLLHEYLLTETTRCVENGVRVSIIGRRDRIPVTLRQTIADAESATARGSPRHPSTRRSVSGTDPTAGRSRCCGGIRASLTRLPSAPTAGAWCRRRTTSRCGCGTRFAS